MKFFIDTADVNEIREAESLGILGWRYNKPYTDIKNRTAF